MSSIGPQLPPQLSKRKRTPHAAEDPSSPPAKVPRNNHEIDLSDSDSDSYGPSAPAPSRPVVGPALPPAAHNDEIDLASGSDSDIGPAAPPVARASQPVADAASSSDDDDDYGPSLPTASSAPKKPIGPALPPTEDTPQRDAWMLAPPPSSSTFTERDPTRLRARKFASSAPGKPPPTPASTSSIWTETPEEKLARLQNAVLGRASAEAGTEGGSARGGRSREDEERDARIAASIEAQRGRSLVEEHRGRRELAGEAKEEDDDPSKRGFDREKDMALGGKIGTAQRRELMNKAANFGGRFQKGSFL